jgi:hypothetical protein
LLRKWIDTNCDPETHQIALGIDWTEIHRFQNAQPRWRPFTLIAPLCQKPYIGKFELKETLAKRGLKPPRLYDLGFPHNNCGGFCVKAGQAQFALLLKTMPERYAWHEEQERITAEHIGKPVTVLRRQRNGVRAPISLKTFREEIEAKADYDRDEWGGCGCAID